MLKVISIEEADEWNKIVRSFFEYEVYYLNEYVRGFQLHEGGIPLLFYVEIGTTRAINVVIKRDIASFYAFRDIIPVDFYFDFATPYGYGGFLVEGNDIEAINRLYTDYCCSNHIVSEFVRFNPLLHNLQQLGDMYEIELLGDTVVMDTTSEDTIWENLTSKNRNMIRKANKNEINVYWGRNLQLMDSFIDMYNETMEEDHAAQYYFFSKEFHKSILNDLRYHSLYFYAEKNGEIISMAVFLFANRHMHYHLAASKREYRKMAPSNLLLYEAAVWAANNGIDVLHLGSGVGFQQDSLYRYKKAFNRAKSCDYYIGQKIFDFHIYRKLLGLRKETMAYNKKKGFFPEYRA